jgi:dynein heavy chain, axonemal
MLDEFNLVELRARLDERNPYAIVALQEAERMNHLLHEIRHSLKELDGGLKVRSNTDRDKTCACV